jgi:SOS-response transcriptional repressor LexA
MNKRQYSVLRYIQDYININNISPTYVEISRNCNVSSDSHAHKVVKALVRDGYLEISSSGIRKIRLYQATGSSNA